MLFNKFVIFFKKNINYFFLLIISIIPSNSSYLLNGLPIVSQFEIIFFFLLLFSIFLKVNFNHKFFKFFIIIILILKIILFFSPKIGVEHKQYIEGNSDFIKTYNTFWNKNISSLQNFNWNMQLHFPLDWLPVEKKTDDKKSYSNLEDFRNLKLLYKSQFLYYSDGEIIRLDDYDLTQLKKIQIYNIDNKKKNLFFFKKDDLFSDGIFLKKGIYQFYIETLYFQNWSFQLKSSLSIPFIDRNIFLSSFLLKKIFTLDTEKNFQITTLNIFKQIADLYDVLSFILLCLIFLEIIIFFKINKQIFIVANFFILFSLINYFNYKYNLLLSLEKFNYSISFALSLLIFLFYFWKFRYLYNFNLNFIRIFLGTTIFLSFFYYYFPLIEKVYFYDFFGNDWFHFQTSAREIVVNNMFPHPDLLFRPGLKYIFAFQHIIFDKSAFAQKMFEIILFILSNIYIYKIVFKISENETISCTIPLIFSMIFIGENFILYLGKGLSAYYAYFFILFLVNLFLNCQLNSKIIAKSFFPCLVVLWLREDYIFLLFSLAFLSINLNYEFKQNSFLFFVKKCFLNKYLIMYGTMLILCLSTLLVKTGVFNFYFLNHPGVSGSTYYKFNFIENFYRLITGTNGFEYMPRTYSPIIIGALLIIFYNFLKFNKFKSLNFGFHFLILACFMPYFFLINNNYPPRYSINLLILSLLIITYNFIQTDFYKKNIKNKY